MKRRIVKPIGARSSTVRSQQPEQLNDLVEDPVPKKRDMAREQRAALKKPGHSDPRVSAAERDQGRTR